MIRAFAETITAGVDLLESEGRLARLHVLRLICVAAVVLGGALLGTLGFIGVGVGATLLIAQATGVPLAIIIVSSSLLTIAIAATWYAVAQLDH